MSKGTNASPIKASLINNGPNLHNHLSPCRVPLLSGETQLVQLPQISLEEHHELDDLNLFFQSKAK